MVERQVRDLEVEGSNPIPGSNYLLISTGTKYYFIGEFVSSTKEC